MPIHWDWDWEHEPHDHEHVGPHYHWQPARRHWSTGESKCRSRRYYLSHEMDVCAREFHMRVDESAWCHGSCLVGRVVIETGTEPDSLGRGTFKVVLDVHHFQLAELTVKAKNSDTICVEGKQSDERADTAQLCITREFTRCYKLPRHYDATLARATFSADGILMVTVPAPPKLDDVERVVEIEPTGNYFGSIADPSAAKAIEQANNSAPADGEQANPAGTATDK
ncbi:CG13133 [Drosophila busckii]|uniref:CG13133 n=1 Tax=Drosophila busckii TaxID=30019 RepID=A0A0M4EC50_DROBS|nr:heat shock protein 23 [Drosophila busckii]ALC39145.1 CG13133 [Drosophila busckii]ALC39147.1 CG13133 [Drosophila busckii]